jgi:hypothetical protein
MRRSMREKVAIVASLLVIGLAIWFWRLQVAEVLAMLRLTSG